MNLIGGKVKHKKFGDGVIVEVDSHIICISDIKLIDVKCVGVTGLCPCHLENLLHTGALLWSELALKSRTLGIGCSGKSTCLLDYLAESLGLLQSNMR